MIETRVIYSTQITLKYFFTIHPGLTFNIREAKHPDEIRSAVANTWPETNGKPVEPEGEVPF